MRRLFTVFSTGWPGLALLLLRGVFGIALVIDSSGYLRGLNTPLSGWLTGGVGMAAGGMLLLGLLTPVAGSVAGIGILGVWLSWLPRSVPSLFRSPTEVLFSLLILQTIVLVGPGAFSIDARLFGRREIIIPDLDSSPR